MAVEDDLRDEAERLENAFFSGNDDPLLAELRRKDDSAQRLDALRDVVKFKDDTFVERLLTLGVRPEVAVAVLLVPMILVAWRDGKVDDREQAAILDAAREGGIAAEQIAGRHLRNALARQPDPKLFDAWSTYVRRLWGCFTDDERWQMRTDILQAVRAVAEASGGLLGLTSRISAEERRILAEIESILD